MLAEYGLVLEETLSRNLEVVEGNLRLPERLNLGPSGAKHPASIRRLLTHKRPTRYDESASNYQLDCSVTAKVVRRCE